MVLNGHAVMAVTGRNTSWLGAAGPVARLARLAGMSLVLVFFTGWLASGAALAQEVTADTTGDNAICSGCHRSASRILAHDKLDLENPEKASCLQCHEPHEGSKPEAKGALVRHEPGNPLRVPERNQCQSCHYQYSPLALGERNKGTVHGPVARGNCIDCHNEHALGERSGLRVAEEELCLSCHRREGQEMAEAYRHLPFVRGQCTSCHDPHLAPNRKLLVMPDVNLCQSCHQSLSASMALPVVHSPFAGGKCLSCHDAHASPFKAQLWQAPEQLCVTCHARVQQATRKAVVHRPVARGECLRCHNPHGSANEKLLLAAGEDLCFKCHAGLQSAFAKASRHPVGAQIQCASCHLPHGGDFRKLQVAEGNNLCYTCHQSKAWLYGRIGHSKMPGNGATGACTNCHLPHGSDFQPLLVRNEIELCLSCHQAMGWSQFSHPVGGEYLDPVSGVRLTCTTTCHDPHGTPLEANVTKKGDGLCLTCH